MLHYIHFVLPYMFAKSFHCLEFAHDISGIHLRNSLKCTVVVICIQFSILFAGLWVTPVHSLPVYGKIWCIWDSSCVQNVLVHLPCILHGGTSQYCMGSNSVLSGTKTVLNGTQTILNGTHIFCENCLILVSKVIYVISIRIICDINMCSLNTVILLSQTSVLSVLPYLDMVQLST